MKPKLPLEKETQSACVKLLRTLGYKVYTTSQARASMVSEGIPDLLIMGKGVHVWVEMKRGQKTKLTPAQHEFAELAGAAGVDWHVWRSVDDCVRWLREEQGVDIHAP